MSTQRTNLIGISSVMGAGVFFTINDAAIKFLSGDYALHQVVLIRSGIGLVLMLTLLMPLMGGYRHLRTGRLPLHILRGMVVVFANMTFFLGLAAMPIADATAIFFVAPLIITGFSVIFLGEYVGLRRWGAVFVGLIGVIIIIRPGTESFQLAALLPLAAAFGYAGLHILTRYIGVSESALTMTFYIQLTFVVVSVLFGLTLGDGKFASTSSVSLEFLTRAWGRPDSGDYLVFMLVGIASTAGGFLISQAYRLCEAGLAAPFEYIALPLSVFWGLVVFGEWPDRASWIGIGLIVGSGLYMAWREARLHSYIATKRPKRR
ncbi:MAG: DMT family transporter [Rhodobacteraceae bacterium]|nr:DMT family transporter [Paracoccaceae bacterium]